MAFVKEKRQVGVTAAKIGVTRGGGAKAVEAAVSSSSIVDAVQTYNNYYQDIKIKKEKALGKQLAENLDIIYEDYTDENGVTTKIAAGYKRPDDQLKTNWSLTEFDEEVVGNFVDATAENAKTIIANIKADMKTKINIRNTTAQVAEGFDVALSEPMQAIIDNLPFLASSRTLDKIGSVFFFSTTPWTKFNDFNSSSLLIENCIHSTLLKAYF